MKLSMYAAEDAGLPPYPALSFRCLLVIEKAICTTWERMCTHSRAGFDLPSAVEDKVTHELYERLFDEVFDHGIVDGFNREVFMTVRREPKIRNFDALHLDKMPDLLVEFVGRPSGVMNSQYGLFIECKPVDARHTTGACYCDQGLIRFIRGDYAWAMRNAMMIGYARAGNKLAPELTAALGAPRREPIPTAGSPIPCPHAPASSVAEQVVTTIHERTFRYPGTDGLPGRISIRHLWLKRM